MHNTLRTIWIVTIITAGITSISNAGTWTTFDPPGATVTSLYDIDGSNIVGLYADASGWKSFIYNNTTRTIRNFSQSLIPYGVSNNFIIGTALGEPTRGFLCDYDGSNLTYFSMPGSTDTYAWRIEGNNIVGNYYANHIRHGFLYDGKNWTTIDFPGAIVSTATAIYNGRIAGNCLLPNEYWNGFICDGSTLTSLNIPGATDTVVSDISERGIVGYYYNRISTVDANTHSYLYDGSTWTTLNAPGAIHTTAMGISGNYIVGNYNDGTRTHGFIYTIPEPATLLLLAFGGLALRKRNH